jgi:hypothetical protein
LIEIQSSSNPTLHRQLLVIVEFENALMRGIQVFLAASAMRAFVLTLIVKISAMSKLPFKEWQTYSG